MSSKGNSRDLAETLLTFRHSINEACLTLAFPFSLFNTIKFSWGGDAGLNNLSLFGFIKVFSIQKGVCMV